MVKRVELAKQLPLDMPFSLHVFPIYKCNFKCNYCVQSLSNEELKSRDFSKDVMSFETYKKAIDDLVQYDKKLKALIFAGHGEPLMHPDIVRMVAYAKECNVAERVEITTNGTLLTQKMSNGLIGAGIDRLKISIQGINKERYFTIAKYDLNYELFLSNLKYFFDNKKHTEVYIKIIDIALENDDEAQLFKKMFEPVATYVDIEYAIPFVHEMDFSDFKSEFDRCKQGHMKVSNICSMPFYMQVIVPNGDILPCCSLDIPVILGNIHKASLKEIWESKKLNNFLTMMLKDKDKNLICKECSVPRFGLQDGDYLDDYKEHLIKKYEG